MLIALKHGPTRGLALLGVQSDAPVARRIENYIRKRIAAGDTKSEIKAKLVAQFGPSILAAPPSVTPPISFQSALDCSYERRPLRPTLHRPAPRRGAASRPA